MIDNENNEENENNNEEEEDFNISFQTLQPIPIPNLLPILELLSMKTEIFKFKL